MLQESTNTIFWMKSFTPVLASVFIARAASPPSLNYLNLCWRVNCVCTESALNKQTPQCVPLSWWSVCRLACLSCVCYVFAVFGACLWSCSEFFLRVCYVFASLHVFVMVLWSLLRSCCVFAGLECAFDVAVQFVACLLYVIRELEFNRLKCSSPINTKK